MVGDSKGWASVTWRDENNYSPLLNLPAGATLRLDWKGEPSGFAVKGKPPQHSCGTKDIRSDQVLGPIAEHYGPRNWSNGNFVYAPDFTKAADVADIALQNATAASGKLAAGQRQGHRHLQAGAARIRMSMPRSKPASMAAKARCRSPRRRQDLEAGAVGRCRPRWSSRSTMSG